jgi:hypothetical protein
MMSLAASIGEKFEALPPGGSSARRATVNTLHRLPDVSFTAQTF